MWKFLYKTTTSGLKDLPRKVAMVLAKGTLDYFLYLLSNTFLFLKSEGMLPGMLKGERVASLSEAQAQPHNSYLKIRERSSKGPRKIRERSRRPSKPPAFKPGETT